MVLKDRKMLGRLIALQDWSIRGLAHASGFKSHSYLNRLVLGRVGTCSAERAVALCANLQVPLDSLFVTKMSSDPVQASKGRPFRAGAASPAGTADGAASGRGSRRETAALAAEVKSA